MMLIAKNFVVYDLTQDVHFNKMTILIHFCATLVKSAVRVKDGTREIWAPNARRLSPIQE